MGLLEKALEYKKAINRQGKITLIDTIQGPAETEMIDGLPGYVEDSGGSLPEAGPLEGINEDSGDSLFDLPEDDDYSPLDSLKEQKGKPDNDYDNSWIEGINSKNTEENFFSQENILNPLTSEDEPVLPRDIDAVVETRETDYFTDKKENDSMPDKVSLDESDSVLPSDPFIMSDNGKTEEQEESLMDFQPSINFTQENGVRERDPGADMHGIRFHEQMTLYEIGKEISKSETKKTLFEVVVFSIMGQIGTSFASIMIREPGNDKWIIAHSSGLKSGNRTFSFDASAGILKNIKKEIIDIDKFKDNPDYREYYKELNSIGAKLLIPWFLKGKVLGILALGKKITDDDYTAEEMVLVEAVCEASAIELSKINVIEKLKTENENSKTDLTFLQHINDIQEKIVAKSDLKTVKEIIKSEFEAIGIIKYSVYIKDVIKDKFIPFITGENNLMSPIDVNNNFISFIKNKKDSPGITDFLKMEIVHEAFNEAEIKEMSVLWVYPFLLGSHLTGFIMIFKVRDELQEKSDKTELESNLDKFSKMVLSNLINIKNIDPDENRYTDNIERIFNKIESELLNSKNLNIPLSLTIFSVKNYKRYGNVFGYKKAKELIIDFSELINSRLSDTDFSARYDRNKILIVSPGKDKKFAMTFANTIRNEFMQRFKRTGMQLLITFLISEYPEDGDDLLTLIDIID